MTEGKGKTVGKLAQASMIRRICTGPGAILVALACATPAMADWQPVADIAEAAERLVYEQTGASTNNIVATAGFLDPRLNLPRCRETLDPVLRPGTELVGRVVVGVHCRGDKPWKVYLPVHIAVLDEIVVTARHLPRGHVIASGDIVVSERDISALRGDYLPASINVIGRRVTRGVGNGLVLRSSVLEKNFLVEKGQAVTLSVRSNSINIQMAGVADADGVANELIQVRNTTSGRIVEGRVLSQGVVEVLLH